MGAGEACSVKAGEPVVYSHTFSPDVVWIAYTFPLTAECP